MAARRNRCSQFSQSAGCGDSACRFSTSRDVGGRREERASRGTGRFARASQEDDAGGWRGRGHGARRRGGPRHIEPFSIEALCRIETGEDPDTQEGPKQSGSWRRLWKRARDAARRLLSCDRDAAHDSTAPRPKAA